MEGDGYSAALDFSTATGGARKILDFETPQSAKADAPLRLLRRTTVVLTAPPHSRNKKSTQTDAFFIGGGRWIRTIEVRDNRFTVCPLWPLGNPSKNGAGDGTRTRNLLITNQLLCQLSYTSKYSTQEIL